MAEAAAKTVLVGGRGEGKEWNGDMGDKKGERREAETGMGRRLVQRMLSGVGELGLGRGGQDPEDHECKLEDAPEEGVVDVEVEEHLQGQARCNRRVCQESSS